MIMTLADLVPDEGLSFLFFFLKVKPHLFFIFIYFIYYVYNILSVCLKARRGRQTSLQMVVSHHVVAGN